MPEWYHLLLAAVIAITLSLSVWFSLRYRRQQDKMLRGLYAAKMNMSMGSMLLLIAVLQVVLFEMSSLRLALAAIFALTGLFNLFAGRKNLEYYRLLSSRLRTN